MKECLSLLVILCAGALTFAACGGDATLKADAGSDFVVDVGQSPEFDGCGSTGDIESYSWQIVEAPEDMTDDVGKFLRETIDECSFVLESSMEVADDGVWVIELTVRDGAGETSTDQITATVDQ